MKTWREHANSTQTVAQRESVFFSHPCYNEMTLNKLTLFKDLLYRLYYMPSTVLSDLPALTHLNLTKTPRDTCYWIIIPLYRWGKGGTPHSLQVVKIHNQAFWLQSSCYYIYCLSFLTNSYLLIWERGRKGEREIPICCSTYLRVHWLTLVCTLTGDQTPNLDISGWRSSQLSHLARAYAYCLSLENYKSTWHIVGAW